MDKSAEATKLMAVRGLGVKCGQTVTVSVEGADEDTAEKEIKTFFETNFCLLYFLNLDHFFLL